MNKISPFTVAASTIAARRPFQRMRKNRRAINRTTKHPTPAVSVGVAIPK